MGKKATKLCYLTFCEAFYLLSLCSSFQYSKYKTGRLYQLNRSPQEPKWQEHDLQRIMYKIQARVRYSYRLIGHHINMP